MASEADGKTNAKPTELGPEVFDDFDAFLKQAIRDYYDRSWKSRRGQLHRAGHRVRAGDVDGRGFDQGRQRPQEGGARRGRCGGAAPRPPLRAVGPAGHHPDGGARRSRWPATWSRTRRRSASKVGAYRTLIAETRARFEEAQGGYRAGRYDAASRNLMVDGLLKRFLDEIDAK